MRSLVTAPTRPGGWPFEAVTDRLGSPTYAAGAGIRWQQEEMRDGYCCGGPMPAVQWHTFTTPDLAWKAGTPLLPPTAPPSPTGAGTATPPHPTTPDTDSRRRQHLTRWVGVRRETALRRDRDLIRLDLRGHGRPVPRADRPRDLGRRHRRDPDAGAPHPARDPPPALPRCKIAALFSLRHAPLTAASCSLNRCCATRSPAACSGSSRSCRCSDHRRQHLLLNRLGIYRAISNSSTCARSIASSANGSPGRAAPRRWNAATPRLLHDVQDHADRQLHPGPD